MACQSCAERRKKLREMKDRAVDRLLRPKTPPAPVKKDAAS